MPEANEIWQVDVNGAVYDAAFSELPEWIDGGSLLPADKVRKGNLRWIEARLVPALVPFFNAKENGEQMPIIVSVTEPCEEAVIAFVKPAAFSAPDASIPTTFDPDRCALHSDLEAFYLCEGCANGFCKACPTSYSGTVKICPLCGAMCKPASEVNASQQQLLLLQQSVLVNESFGSSDFFTALRHPWKFKASLFFGAIFFAFFSLGKSAASIGGIYFFVSALFCVMLSNMLTFGVLSNTVDNFIQGKLDANFMPDFENFEIWDDIVHPFFLSIAAYLVAFGPFLLTLTIGFYLVTSAMQGTADAINRDLERIPGTHMYAGRELADQSEDVKDVLARIDRERAERIAGMANQARLTSESADAGQHPEGNTAVPIVDGDSREQEELWVMATESRKQPLESVVGKTSETQEQERGEMLNAFLQLPAPLVVIGFIAFLCGAIFFPAACAVAGYSKSFMATINPLVGLDTMKRLGGSYIKILVMGLVLVITSGFVSMLIAAILSPLDLPGLGNLPATGFAALFAFYLWTVFSCVIGFALFKKADKLGLIR